MSGPSPAARAQDTLTRHRAAPGDRALAPAAPAPLDSLRGRLGNRCMAAAVTGGAGLPQDFRQEMEARFGTDFGTVRLSTVPHLGAAAVTRGEEIVLAPGVGNPSDPLGRRVLAHELAHVVQQRRGGGAMPTLDGTGGLEADARAAAGPAATGRGGVAVAGASAAAPAALDWKELARDATALYDSTTSGAAETFDEAVDYVVPESVQDTARAASRSVDSFLEENVPDDVREIASEVDLFDPTSLSRVLVKKYAPVAKKAVEEELTSYENSDIPATATNPILGPVIDLLDTVTDGGASKTYRQTQAGLALGAYNTVEGLAMAATNPTETATGLLKVAETVGPVHVSGLTNAVDLVGDLADEDVELGEAFERYNRAELAAQAQRVEDTKNIGKAVFADAIKAWDDENYGRVAGLALFEVLSFAYGGPATKAGATSKVAKTAGAVGKLDELGALGKLDDLADAGKLDDVADAGKLGKGPGAGGLGDLFGDLFGGGKLDEAADAGKLDEAADAGKLDEAADAGKLDDVEELADVIPINRAFLDSLPQVLDDAGELIMGIFDEVEPRMAANGGPVAGPRSRPRGTDARRPPKTRSRAANDTKPRGGGPKRAPKRPAARKLSPEDKKFGEKFDKSFEGPDTPVPARAPDKVVEVDTRLPGVIDPSLSKKAADTQRAAELGLKPGQLAKADKLLGQPLTKAFMGAWKRALERSKAAQTKMDKANKLLDKADGLRADGKLKAAEKAEKKAQKLAADAYKDTQGKFWEEVYSDPKNVKKLKEAGLTVETTKKAGKKVPKGTAPYLKDKKGKRQKVTLEHSDRKSDVPRKAVDPDGLLLSLGRENSVYLEAIRRIMRDRMRDLGMPDFKDWSWGGK